MLIIQKTFKNKKPTIFMVTTPIGNLDDFNNRSIETLNEVNTIYCEDTRTSSILLNKYNIKTTTKSLHKFNEVEKVDTIYNDLLLNKNVAIISDAGVPGINDPGMKLIYELNKKNLGFNVTAIGAGPAYIHSLICSRQIVEKNFYYGFLPKKNAEINEVLQFFKNLSNFEKGVAISFYESVHRVRKTLEKIDIFFKGHKLILSIGRELTKINEEIVILDNFEIKNFLDQNLIEKGEFCINLFIEPNFEKKEIDENFLIEKMNNLIASGIRKKEALKLLKLEYEFDLETIFKKN